MRKRNLVAALGLLMFAVSLSAGAKAMPIIGGSEHASDRMSGVSRLVIRANADTLGDGRRFGRCMRAKYGPRYFARVPHAVRYQMAQACQ